MTKQEFYERSGEVIVTDKQWADIEYVYTWHPSIDEVEGKGQIATLYKIGGYRVIKDMLPTAKKCEELDRKIRKAEADLTELRKMSLAVMLGGDYEEA